MKVTKPTVRWRATPESTEPSHQMPPLSTSDPLHLGILTTRSDSLFGETIAAVEQAGHTLDLIDPRRLSPILYSDDFHLAHNDLLAAGTLTNLDLIFNHFCGQRIGFYYEAFRILSIPLLNDWQAVDVASDKMKALMRVAGGEIRVPETVLLGAGKFHERMELAEAHLGYPMVMKECRSDRGEKVFLVPDRRTAWEIWCESEPDDLYILQRYLAGDHLRALVLDDAVVYCTRTIPRPGEFRSNRQFSCAVEPFELAKIEATAVVDACRRLGLFYAGVDIIRNAAGLWFIEANAQPGVRGDLALFNGLRERFYRNLGCRLVVRASAERRMKVPVGESSK